MKASEMTNEELAKNIEYTAEVLPDYGGFECADELREAAARLRLKQQSDNYAAAMCLEEVGYKQEICDLRRRLKVAEDALVKLAWSESTNPDWYRCYIREALVAIREEGGAK